MKEGGTLSRRILLIVLDSVGVGQAPDAAKYGDAHANTIGNTAKAVGGLRIPHLAALGLGRVTAIEGMSLHAEIHGAYGYMIPQSAGKDTTNGHYEFVGVTLTEPLPTYPQGFPPDIMTPFEQTIGRKTLGNKPASGTQIIAELGDEHVRTGSPIVYTSADSVFQVAAHEEVIPLEELYRICEHARQLLTGRHDVGRVIARPFIGTPGHYVRTSNRRDYSRDFGDTLLNKLVDKQIPVIGIGKIEDIYGGHGITTGIHTISNDDGITKTIAAMDYTHGSALIFTNLVDFDMLYGHRNDPVGFAHAIEAFDERLPEIISHMSDEDLLMITADHGCDPTTPSTDHSREGVPLLVYNKRMTTAIALGCRDTFADLGATMAEYLHVDWPFGSSFYPQIEVHLK